jgi:hypothetical protein
MALLSIAATIIISLAMTDRARALFWDGNKLYAKCIDPASQLECIGYVMGVLDAATATAYFEEVVHQGAKPQPDRPDLVNKATLLGFRWCLRVGVEAGQAVDDVTNFLRDNPAYRDAAAPDLIAMAMQRAWPCDP